MRYDGLRPRTLVDYRRRPFVYGPGNVRVTLDDEIRTGLNVTDLFDRACPTLQPVPGEIILEVKYDAFLPEIVRQAVQLDGVSGSAFSKYAACRQF